LFALQLIYGTPDGACRERPLIRFAAAWPYFSARDGSVRPSPVVDADWTGADDGKHEHHQESDYRDAAADDEQTASNM
jgi:hypothetical protein